MSDVIGIDLETTYSNAAIMWNGSVEIIQDNKYSYRTIPSMVCLRIIMNV